MTEEFNKLQILLNTNIAIGKISEQDKSPKWVKRIIAQSTSSGKQYLFLLHANVPQDLAIDEKENTLAVKYEDMATFNDMGAFFRGTWLKSSHYSGFSSKKL